MFGSLADEINHEPRECQRGTARTNVHLLLFPLLYPARRSSNTSRPDIIYIVGK